MYQFDQEKSNQIHSVRRPMNTSGEWLLKSIEDDVNQKLQGKGVFAKLCKGAVHISCYFIESDMRRRKTLRGENVPKERTFQLTSKK